MRLDLDPSLPPTRHRRRTAAHRAREHPRQRAPRGRGAGRRAAAAGRRPARTSVVKTAPRPASARVITISDDGVGIGDEDLPHIFDPYFTTRRAGTGLGLPIAKNIIEGLGGSIAVTQPACTSAPTCGSTCPCGRGACGMTAVRGLDPARRRRREDPQAAGPGAAGRRPRRGAWRRTRAKRCAAWPSASSTSWWWTT